MTRGSSSKNSRFPRERHKHLLEDRHVAAWYGERALRSQLSADVYLRQLGAFAERLNLNPESIRELAGRSPDDFRERLIEYAKTLKGEGRLDSYISKTFDGLRSWLRFRRVGFDDFPRLSPLRQASLSRERIPTPTELAGVLERLSLRGRVIALLSAQSGIRPGAIGAYRGTGGLRIEDVPALALGRRLGLTEVPFLIRVRAELSKTRVSYYTLGGEQLAAALVAYLISRREGGEKLQGSSPLISSAELRGAARGAKPAGQGFLTTKAIVKELRGVLHAQAPSTVTWRPYVLRSYFSTRLLLAEANGRITRDLREALMGHDGGVASTYNLRKPWGEDLVREAKRSYSRSYEYLATVPVRAEPAKVDIKQALLEMFGYTEAEAKANAGASVDELRRLLERAGRANRAEGPRQTLGAEVTKRVQRPVAVAEVEKLLAEGWTFVAPLGLDRAILERTSSPAEG